MPAKKLWIGAKLELLRSLWTGGATIDEIRAAFPTTSYLYITQVAANHGFERKRPGGAPKGTLVDAADAQLLVDHRWCQDRNGYVVRSQYVGTSRANMGSKKVYLHRVITACPQGMSVDHINGNKLDNRRANLRIVTQAINVQNRTKVGSNNTSGTRGVSYSKAMRQWCARAQVGTARLHSFFKTREQAEAAVKAWRLAHMPGATS